MKLIKHSEKNYFNFKIADPAIFQYFCRVKNFVFEKIHYVDTNMKTELYIIKDDISKTTLFINYIKLFFHSLLKYVKLVFPN